jgi:hypothetical protein
MGFVPSPATNPPLNAAQTDTFQVVGAISIAADGTILPGLLDGPVTVTTQPDPAVCGAITLDAMGNGAIKPVAAGSTSAVFAASANAVALAFTLNITVAVVPEGFATLLAMSFGSVT